MSVFYLSIVDAKKPHKFQPYAEVGITTVWPEFIGVVIVEADDPEAAVGKAIQLGVEGNLLDFEVYEGMDHIPAEYRNRLLTKEEVLSLPAPNPEVGA